MGGKQKIIRIYISNHSEWNVPDELYDEINHILGAL